MKTAKKLLCNLIIYVVLIIIVASSAFAAADLTTSSSSGLIINAATGQVIYANNENTRVAPGGLAKLMTLYIAAEECSNGSISRSDVVTITDRMIAVSYTHLLSQPCPCVPLCQSLRRSGPVDGSPQVRALPLQP